jgi:hypothetical protein
VPVVSVAGLVKTYEDVEAVKDVAFEVNEGEVFALLGLAADETIGAGYVHDDKVIVGSSGEKPSPAAHESFGEGPGVVHDPLGVVGELGPSGFGQSDGLGRHDMAERAAQHHRTAPLHVLGVVPRWRGPCHLWDLSATCEWWWPPQRGGPGRSRR